MSRSIADPSRDDETHADHLLCDADDHASCVWVRAFGQVDGYRHGHQADGPARDDAADQNHSEIHGRALKDTADSGNNCAYLNSALSSEPIHGEAALQMR